MNDDTEMHGGVTDGGDGGAHLYSLVDYANSEDDAEPPGTVTPVTTNWEPPACWFEPRTASETQEFVLSQLQGWQNIPDSDIAPSRERLLAHFEGGQPYEDYNLSIEDEGYFWFGMANPQRTEDPESDVCFDKLPEWVDRGEVPTDEPRALTPALLAASAYEWLPIPETAVRLNPDAEIPQTVHLPTWIWQDTADIGEVWATAILDRLGIEATTTATPSALTIDPGTDDALLHPADGECVINDDGTIGEPYDGQSAEEEPPCGVTFTRSTTDGEPYELTATITWSVSWTGTGNPEPQPLPSAVLETTHQLTVQEVQAIVR